jgi:hypothetical protein
MPSSFRVEESSEGRSVVVTGPWSSAAATALVSGEANGLVLNYAHGFQEPSLEFLDEWPIRRLNVLDRKLTDLTPLSRVGPTLQSLSVQVASGAQIDLGELPRLRTLAAWWEAAKESIHSVDALQELTLMDYDERTLAPLATHTSLEKVKLKYAPASETLDGAEDLASLAILSVQGARELADIAAISNLADTLRDVGFEACRDIASISDVEAVCNLRFLGVSDCGEIESLKPLVEMTALESLHMWGTTRILDNDLSPLLHLRKLIDLRIRGRRSYRPPIAEVMTQLGIAA